jgi:hypothetical protein
MTDDPQVGATYTDGSHTWTVDGRWLDRSSGRAVFALSSTRDGVLVRTECYRCDLRALGRLS